MGTKPVGAIQFRVLGPLEVLRGGEPVRLGGQHQRVLLALLLLRANELVTTEELVDVLFGERRRESAANAVRVAMSRLRRVLGQDGDRRLLATRPGGYSLRVGTEQSDLARFELLLADARRLVATGNLSDGVARFCEGLELWHGSPLADLALVDCLQADIRRLEQLHHVALLDRLDAELALGAGAELSGELELLVAAEPLDERLRRQLMLALYRSGRHADALAVYRAFGDLLRERLGLEPGPELQRLEQRILVHDPELAPGSPLPNRPERRQILPGALAASAGRLPAAPTPFIGRVGELREVAEVLQEGRGRLTTLTGAGGSGKTRLALAVAALAADEHRDGARFVAFADVVDREMIADAICQTLALSDPADATPEQRLIAWLAPRQLLLVLDNLEHLLPVTQQVTTLLAGCPELTLIATSREPLRLAAERQYVVPVLKPHDAVELFIARARAAGARTDADRAVIADICERLDRLPLAIELAAARLKALSAETILARLSSRVPVLAGGPRDAHRRQQTLAATIDWSHELLNEDEQSVFRRLAVFSGGSTVEAAEAVCQTDLSMLAALVDRSLLTAADGRLRMLQTVRDDALARLEQAGEAADVRRRHRAWFMQRLEAAGLTVYFGPGGSPAALIAPDADNFQIALESAADDRDAEELGQLAFALTGWWIGLGQLALAERWLRLARERDHDGVAPVVRARVLSASASVAWRSGRPHWELSERALAIYRELGDPAGICRELLARDIRASDCGDYAAARTALTEVINLAREHQFGGFLALALSNLADVDIAEGNLAAARVHCEEALAVGEQYPGSVQVTLLNLAHVANLEQQTNEAGDLARRVIELALPRADLIEAAFALMELAWSLAPHDDPRSAARFLGAGEAFLDHSGIALQRTDVVCRDAAMEVLRERLDAGELDALLASSRDADLHNILEEARLTATASQAG
jgi:predicted ATPase/DNA-binding SARP family transcriptional activator